MPKTLFTESGDEVEVPTEEELKELQDKADKVEGLETDLKTKVEALEKYADKDFNFGRLKKANVKEREEMTKDFSAEMKIMANEILKMQESSDTKIEDTITPVKEKCVATIAGEDEELKKKLEAEFVGLGGDKATTPEKIVELYDKARVIVEANIQPPNPLNQYVPTTGAGEAVPKDKNFADTQDGKSLAKTLGLKTEVPKKEKKD